LRRPGGRSLRRITDDAEILPLFATVLIRSRHTEHLRPSVGTRVLTRRIVGRVEPPGGCGPLISNGRLPATVVARERDHVGDLAIVDCFRQNQRELKRRAGVDGGVYPCLLRLFSNCARRVSGATRSFRDVKQRSGPAEQGTTPSAWDIAHDCPAHPYHCRTGVALFLINVGCRTTPLLLGVEQDVVERHIE